MNGRTITLNEEEVTLLMEGLAGHYARSGVPEQITAAMRLAQRLSGFEIDGRPGAYYTEEA